MLLEEQPYVREMLFSVEASENYICSELPLNNLEV
jgi:hypothetical protein